MGGRQKTDPQTDRPAPLGGIPEHHPRRRIASRDVASRLSDPPPELLIFDVDGTLNGIELWWPDLLRRGLRRFADAMGLVLSEPDDRAALAVVGEKNEGVWSPFLPVEQQHRWDELRGVVLPMEVEVLCSGVDYLYRGEFLRQSLRHGTLKS